MSTLRSPMGAGLRRVLPSRQLVFYVLLFAVSYAGLLVYARPGAVHTAATFTGVSRVPAGTHGMQVRESALPAPTPEPRTGRPMHVARGDGGPRSPATRVDGAALPADVTGMTVLAEDAEAIVLSRQASSAAEPQERAKAIVKLRNTASTPEALAALSTILGNDQAVRNRLLAVAALRSLAAQGDPDGTIRVALSRAASDADPRVASLARDAMQATASVEAEPQS